MRKQLAAFVMGAALLLAPAVRLAAQSTPWIHIHVEEQGEKASTVQVNLPLALVRTVSGVLPKDMAGHLREGKLQIKNTDVTVADLRRMWQELRTAGDAEFVSVEEKHQRVRVARQGDRVRINVEDLSGKQSRVRVEVPVDVVDALLEGEGAELNLEAAIQRLQDKRGELVQVQGGETNVRIWIDEKG